MHGQISVKNRQYTSVQEWIEAEIADQRKERKRLERAAHLRLKKLKSLQRYLLLLPVAVHCGGGGGGGKTAPPGF